MRTSSDIFRSKKKESVVTERERKEKRTRFFEDFLWCLAEGSRYQTLSTYFSSEKKANRTNVAVNTEQEKM